MTGRQFEAYVVKVLGSKGYWAHRMAPDESGQQPFDIIALKKVFIVCAFDAKVVSSGSRFSFDRIEDNQLNAFHRFHKCVDCDQLGFLVYCDDEIYYLDYFKLIDMMAKGEKSVNVKTLPVWEPI